MIILTMILYPAKYSHDRLVVLALIGYGIAKISEATDKQIYGLTNNLVGGHVIKHLSAAVSVFLVARYLKVRRPI